LKKRHAYGLNERRASREDVSGGLLKAGLGGLVRDGGNGVLEEHHQARERTREGLAVHADGTDIGEVCSLKVSNELG